jgi:DNA-binding Lrp family transcriptional regulator
MRMAMNVPVLWAPGQCLIVATCCLNDRLMDDLDRAIVACLQDGARRSFRDIGQQVGLTPPAVKRRVDRLEAEGVIRGYTAIVDPAMAGWTTQAFVFLHVEGRMHRALVDAAVRALPEIQSAHTLAGEAGALLRVRARDTTHLEHTLERLRRMDGVTRTETQVVLSTLFERAGA